MFRMRTKTHCDGWMDGDLKVFHFLWLRMFSQQKTNHSYFAFAVQTLLSAVFVDEQTVYFGVRQQTSLYVVFADELPAVSVGLVVTYIRLLIYISAPACLVYGRVNELARPRCVLTHST